MIKKQSISRLFLSFIFFSMWLNIFTLNSITSVQKQPVKTHMQFIANNVTAPKKFKKITTEQQQQLLENLEKSNNRAVSIKENNVCADLEVLSKYKENILQKEINQNKILKKKIDKGLYKNIVGNSEFSELLYNDQKKLLSSLELQKQNNGEQVLNLMDMYLKNEDSKYKIQKEISDISRNILYSEIQECLDEQYNNVTLSILLFQKKGDKDEYAPCLRLYRRTESLDIEEKDKITDIYLTQKEIDLLLKKIQKSIEIINLDDYKNQIVGLDNRPEKINLIDVNENLQQDHLVNNIALQSAPKNEEKSWLSRNKLLGGGIIFALVGFTFLGVKNTHPGIKNPNEINTI